MSIMSVATSSSSPKVLGMAMDGQGQERLVNELSFC